MESYGITDQGTARAANEDHFVVADLVRTVLVQTSSVPAVQLPPFSEARRRLLLVADGVGGHEGGELASRVVADALVGCLADAVPVGSSVVAGGSAVVEREIRAAIEHCQALVDRIAEAEVQLAHMGTTVTLAYVVRPYMVIGHVGDSRCYLLRRGKLQQLTRDHNVAQERVDAGELTAAAAARSADARMLTAAIGGGLFGVAPDVFTVDIQPGDVVLLCTDGLTEDVPDDGIRDILDAGWPADEACRLLVEAAKSGGGRDNITCVVTRFETRGGPFVRGSSNDRVLRGKSTGVQR